MNQSQSVLCGTDSVYLYKRSDIKAVLAYWFSWTIRISPYTRIGKIRLLEGVHVPLNCLVFSPVIHEISEQLLESSQILSYKRMLLLTTIILLLSTALSKNFIVCSGAYFRVVGWSNMWYHLYAPFVKPQHIFSTGQYVSKKNEIYSYSFYPRSQLSSSHGRILRYAHNFFWRL